MSPRPWGSLVHRGLARLAPALLAGCSAAPAPPPEPPPAPPSTQTPQAPARPTPVADPAGAAAGVGSLVRVGHEPKHKIAPNTFQHAVPFGQGLMVLVGFEQDHGVFGRPECAIATPTPDLCEGYVVLTWTDPSRATSFPQVTSSDDSVGDPSKLVPAPLSLRKYSPGKAGVYASGSRTQGESNENVFTVQFIGADGKMNPFLEERGSRFTEADLIETKSGHLAVLRQTPVTPENRPYPAVGALFAAKVTGEGGKHKLESPVPLGIGDVWVDGRASDARDARTQKLKPSWGEQRLLPVLDSAGQLTDEAWLVWFEATPPRGVEPEPEPRPSKARGKKGKHQCGRPSTDAFWDRYRDLRGGAMDGCGGRASRRLADPSVQKKMHITRLSPSGSPGRDSTFALPKDFDAEGIRLEASPVVGGGLTVNGVTFDEMLRPQNAAAKGGPLKLSPGMQRAATRAFTEAPAAQRVLSATVDQASGEALVVFYEENATGSSKEPLEGPIFARRYSALGEPLGEPVWLSKGIEGLSLVDYVNGYSVPKPPVVAARGGEAWVVLSPEWGYYLVGGARNGAFVPLPPACDGGSLCHDKHTIAAVVPGKSGGVDLVGAVDKGSFVAHLDLGSGSPEPPHGIDLPSSVEPVALLGGLLRREKGDLAFWREMPDAQGQLVEPGEAGEAAKIDRPAYGQAPVWLQPVWDDVVMISQSGHRKIEKVTATWLRAGKTVELKPSQIGGNGAGNQPQVTSGSPLLPGGEWILPSEPGDPIAVPDALAKALRDCPFALPTGPRRLLLACTEPGSAERPEIVAGVRVVRY